MKHEMGLKMPSDLNDSDEPIYQALMSAIVEQQLPPGSKLPEEALAGAFGISRTGIRKVLQRLAAVQMVVLTPKRGAQVATPGVEEGRDIFRTRAMLECANLSDVISHCQSPHIKALEKISEQEKQAHYDRDGAAAIRLSAAFHIQLQAISGNQVLTEMVSRLTQRSSLVIAAYGAPWQQGCRCDDHDNLIDLLRKKTLPALTQTMEQHFSRILNSLRFERTGEVVPDFNQLFAAKEGKCCG